MFSAGIWGISSNLVSSFVGCIDNFWNSEATQAFAGLLLRSSPQVSIKQRLFLVEEMLQLMIGVTLCETRVALLCLSQILSLHNSNKASEVLPGHRTETTLIVMDDL